MDIRGKRGAETLIGRDRELAELTAGLDDAAGGRGGVWLITGEPGIGKSRLFEAVEEHAIANSMSVHWGRCWEAGGAPAYWPWIQVLRSVISQGDPASPVSKRNAVQLAQVLPELGDGVNESEKAAQLEPEQAVFALMDAVVNTLRDAGATAPVAVLLEDFHSADPSSITLLDFACRQVRMMPLLVVANYRETEARREGVHDGLMKAARSARTMRLNRFSEEEVAVCVREMAGFDPGGRVVSAIHEASEGNPLYAIEIADLMISRGDLIEGKDRIDIAIPESVKAVIGERAERLDQSTRDLLKAASVIGREFRLEDLANLLETGQDDVEDLLAEAVAARIIDRDGANGYRFVHILIQEVFHSSLGDEQRHALHRRRAELLADLEADDGAIRWSELAHHLLEAGPAADDQAFDACVQAAEQAMDQLAFGDAAELYEQALTVFDRLKGSDPIERCDLLLDRAESLIKADNISQGRVICREAAEAARRLGDADLLARAALTYGSVFVFGDVDTALVELLQETLGMIDEKDSAIRARLTARLAAAMQPAEDPGEAMDLAREAIAMARRVNDRAALLSAIRSGCSALMDFADPEERLILNREHVALAKELGVPFEALRGHMRIVIDALELGDMDACVAAIDAYDRLASRTDLPHHLWPVASFRAMCALVEGRFEEAGDLINEARRQAEPLEDPNAERCMALQTIASARAREAFEEMGRSFEVARRELRPTGFSDFFLRLVGVSNFARMERIDEAPRDWVVGLTEDIVNSRFFDRSVLCSAAEMVAASGNAGASENIFDRLQPFAEHWVTWGLYGMACEGPVSRHLALLASAAGRDEDAQRLFDQALDSARRGGAMPCVARTSYEYARHLAHVGGSQELRARLLADAREIADDLGLQGLIGLIAAHISPEDGPSSPQPAALPTADSFHLAREGEIWVCAFGDKTFNLKDTKGVQLLARLVAEPGKAVHALDLTGARADDTIDLGDAGEILDDTARTQYRRRIEELRAEIDEAEGFNDPGRAARARDELEVITAELSRAFGLGGRKRRSGSAAERARVNVQRRLRDAVKRIAEQSPEAGKHLDWALKTGMYCTYDPS
jgi:tetratricopeptide (TPR) repeat protein